MCTDKKVISPNAHMTNAYQYFEKAASLCKHRENHTHKEWHNKNAPVPKDTVEGFYLVPESLFDEILERYTKE